MLAIIHAIEKLIVKTEGGSRDEDGDEEKKKQRISRPIHQ